MIFYIQKFIDNCAKVIQTELIISFLNYDRTKNISKVNIDTHFIRIKNNYFF